MGSRLETESYRTVQGTKPDLHWQGLKGKVLLTIQVLEKMEDVRSLDEGWLNKQDWSRKESRSALNHQ